MSSPSDDELEESAVEPPEEGSDAPAAKASLEEPTAELTEYTGAILKQIRESKGTSLKEISERTKVGVPSLIAVEAERYEELPNARIYVRGFVRCLASELGLSPDRVAATYLSRWEQWQLEQKKAAKTRH